MSKSTTENRYVVRVENEGISSHCYYMKESRHYVDDYDILFQWATHHNDAEVFTDAEDAMAIAKQYQRSSAEVVLLEKAKAQHVGSHNTEWYTIFREKHVETDIEIEEQELREEAEAKHQEYLDAMFAPQPTTVDFLRVSA